MSDVTSGLRRTLILGDIHGCFDEMMHLVQAAGLAKGDLLVSVGDLVDRGPKSYEVVSYFREEPQNRLAVLGNHEEKHLSGRADGPDNMPERITHRSVTKEQYTEMLEYFRGLPLWLGLPEVLVVHAGLDPSRSLESQDRKVLTGRGSQGRPGFDGKTPWWFDAPSFSWPKPVVFGHLVYRDVCLAPAGNLWALDTGAAVGGMLTGLLLPEFRLIQESTPDYLSVALARWRPIFMAEDLPDKPWSEVLGLNPAEWGDMASLIAEVQILFRVAMEQIARDVRSLREETQYATMLPIEKARCMGQLRQDPRFGDPYGKCVLRCFPAGPTPGLVQKYFPTPAAVKLGLKAALQVPGHSKP